MADLLLKKEIPLNRFKFLQRSGGTIFVGSLGLFFLIVVIFAGLALFNRSQARTRDELSKDIRVKQDELRPELLNQIFLLESRLENMQNLLDNHPFVSNSLKFLEDQTLPQVRFLNFDLKIDTRKLEMAGEAANYATLSEQIMLFEKHPQVEKVEFGGVTLGSGNLVNFRLSIIFRPSLLKISE